MEFLCLVHVDQERFERFSPAEKEAIGRAHEAYYEWLVANGHNVASGPLQAPETATVLRSRNGRLSMTDGPYVETKEHVGGFMLIRARDRDEALAVAARSPILSYGAVEVRQTSDRKS